MNWKILIPILLPLTSFIPALLILMIREEQKTLRTTVNMIGAIAKLVLVGVIAYGVYQGLEFEARFPLVGDLDFILRVDGVSLLFAALSAALWLLTTIYAIGYLEGSAYRKRFFCFFSLCVTATMGISLAGNLITLLIFYEMLTLVTYPLVVHRGTEKALRAGRVYLVYTLSGGTLFLMGTAWIHVLAGPVEFVRGGSLGPYVLDHQTQLTAIFILMMIGFGVKCALVPLHGWLPKAMVAPAPVSALLHAVAVVKAGAFGIVRLIYNVFGTDTAEALGVLQPLAYLASFTILYGSLRALFQVDIKKRLAYSTISQLSYIVLGLSIWGPIGTVGALVHLVHQGMMKITLFFCAGNLAEELDIHRVDQLNGVGRRMPWTMIAFSVAALGMIGVPPGAGFISKWYLGAGAASARDYGFIAVLCASSLLNAAYFLPMIHAAWFRPPSDHMQQVLENHKTGRPEISPLLLWPTVVTAIMSLSAGVFAASPISPLGAARMIVERVYFP
ncbi:complex I subunit 5 family protein [Oligoflexus tunisiensis]|uniref:complex I subunit 5 family protein n=1 Tax=Oligoflexus tunisiensis TaxID=708132 RepID=UPI000A587753|nr:proton-conducting transporter membrane subunit [Oligoflexus tunisiensis]